MRNSQGMGTGLRLLIVCLAICSVKSDFHEDTNGRLLRRSRRYVVFPEGSTFNAAFCITIKGTTGPDSIFTEGVNWGLSFDLPNETIHDREMRYEFPVLLRRHKRDLYIKMEKLISSSGMRGRECVLKAICEAGQQLPPRRGILEEIFRIIFVNSGNKALTGNMRDRYEEAYAIGAENGNCNDFYPCPISILDLGLSFGEFSRLSGYPD